MSFTVEERYDMLEKSVGLLTEVSGLMADSRVYNEADVASLSDLLKRIMQGMQILDPDRATQFFVDKVEALGGKLPEKFGGVYDGNLGQYL